MAHSRTAWKGPPLCFSTSNEKITDERWRQTHNTQGMSNKSGEGFDWHGRVLIRCICC